MNFRSLFPYLLPVIALSGILSSVAAELQIPANTAYTEPVNSEIKFTKEGPISGWTNSETRILWFGNLPQAGAVECSMEVALPEGEKSKLRLSCGGESREIEVSGKGEEPVLADFGKFEIKTAGYQEFRLEKESAVSMEVQALHLSGAPTKDAHFNRKPRRNAASVHLAYPVSKETEVAGFYGEMTGVEEPLYTYYMACGWHRGYFGMQVNSESERRIIFSVWDSGGEAVDRKKVDDINRVKLVAKGEDVHSGSFGNEGTGGHSHLKFQWKTGEKQRFYVTAEPVDKTFTIYSGYYFRPDTGKWMLISSWKAPKEGGYMRGLYSFSENFAGKNGHLVRKALYGNQWIKSSDGDWIEITKASFSHDGTGKEDRLDRFMGVENGEFFLSHGGFVKGFTKFGEPFDRPAIKTPPVLSLPELVK